MQHCGQPASGGGCGRVCSDTGGGCAGSLLAGLQDRQTVPNAIGMWRASGQGSQGHTGGSDPDSRSVNPEAARPTLPTTHTHPEENLPRNSVSVEHDFLKNAVEAETLSFFTLEET